MHCSSVWTLCSKSNLASILKLQMRAAKVILDTDTRARFVPLFNKLKWIPFYEEAKINRSVLLYRRKSDELPTYLNDLLIKNCDIFQEK